MSSSPAQASNPANASGSPTKRDSNPSAQSPAQNATGGHDTTPTTAAITIPQAQPIPKPKGNFPAGWLHSDNNTNNGGIDKTGFSIPVGRPTTPRRRNRNGLTINTERPNPFLNVGGMASPEKTEEASSKMTTPAESPTTPNSRMIFKMDGVDEEK
ncbi:hypothetical protein P171DRAFT_481589 [Karstenula rhodostoma CBS 690.94]|uniref:Uncharacterized protein n=1 Tax=Karstenula rhodostoma CBS 690.94 TaxID=1392251 RepID=A0A9P4PTH2_9PLEO|nr:hypothetical protein P171DRAFT_481589 [Karstenula rhodostoma CBS 690.94]